MDSIGSKCKTIVEKYVEAASKAFRDEIGKKNTTAEKLFEELAKDEKISEAVFCKMVQAQEGLEIDIEHAKLLCRSIESGGISERSFLSFIQRFYTVVKDTALTDNSAIEGSTTIRKLEKTEMLEVIEGPILDEKYGVSRVRVRCLQD